MMSDFDRNTPGNHQLCVVDQGDVSPDGVTALLREAVVASAPHAVVEITGPAAVQCLQGLITVDLEARGDGSFQYGALLTAKGMIVSDLWVARADPSVILYLPPVGKEAVLTTLKRSLPPRLAQFADRSAEQSAVRIAGPRALSLLQQAGFLVPEAGQSQSSDYLTAARPALGLPFALQYHGPIEWIDGFTTRLLEAGVASVPYEALHIARILAGWPSLNAEIDAKTLPQEARFDEIDGVSHTKGCYLGQETVARLHFRGHTNKRVVGLRFDAKPNTSSAAITRGGRELGRLTSLAWLGPDNGYLGLGMIRREVAVGQQVNSGGATAVTADLPFEVSS